MDGLRGDSFLHLVFSVGDGGGTPTVGGGTLTVGGGTLTEPSCRRTRT